MLVSFKVSNFLSFDKETEINLHAGKIRKNSNRVFSQRKNRILKCLAVFGPNASGKSNLFKALFFMKYCILQNKIMRGFSNKYCRIKEINSEIPSKFEVSLLINKKVYVYGFSILLFKNKFIEEWLYEKETDDNKKMLFRVNKVEESFELGKYFRNKKAIDRLTLYGNDYIGSNSLFLNDINDKKGKMYDEFPELQILKSVFEWFIFSLKIHFPSDELDFYPDFIESNIDDISKIMKSLDTGVIKMYVERESLEQIKQKLPTDLINDIYDNLISEESAEKKGIIARSSKQLYIFEVDDSNELVAKSFRFNHQNDMVFDMEEESDGTVHLLDLVEILLSTDRDRTYVIDEIERCLHPSITTKILQLFLDTAIERNNQLIITSHESRILAEDLLRNDEILFMKKDNNGVSNISTLDSKKLRSDKRIYQAFFDLKNELNTLPSFDEETLATVINNTEKH